MSDKPFAVHNLAVRAIEVDEDHTYSIAQDGPRFYVEPLSMGDGPAVFDSFDEAEGWRMRRLGEMADE
ncbi:MAG: hypothetical protein ACTHNA_14390 [Sphingopyxis terrae]|uniref:hypothetical protein n=1 Tax=Sphingopyxis terrae TaxID=33052 RepID=UPI003F8209E2